MLWKALPLSLLTCAPSYAAAQSYIDEISNYAEKVHARRIAPLEADAAFGSQISYLDGSTRFSIVDISLPGNNPLPVELRRSRSNDERYLTREARLFSFGNLYDWTLDVPYLEGTFSSQGWVVGPESDPQRHARCSRQQKPYMILSGDFYEEKMWGGYTLNIPGNGGTLLLKADAGIPMPEDGRSYPWVAEGNIRISCLPNLANGQPGEGFIALDGNGFTYTFDTLLTKQMANFRMRSYHSVSQYKVYIAASKVEDRNGNWVRYNYDNELLTSITASDGRSITLNYSGGRLVSATTSGRTWTYRYREPGDIEDGGLAAVVLPDGQQWSYGWTGSLRPARMPPPQEGDTPCDMILGNVNGPYQYVVTHPAGATATYSFEHKALRRTNLDACSSPAQPSYYALWSLTERLISGPGIKGDRTSFEITSHYPDEAVRWSKVTLPDGSVKRYGYGRTFEIDEGKLLREQTHAADGTLLEEITNYYHASPPPGAFYAARVGRSLHFMQATDGLVQPLWKATTVREQTSYTREVLGFDALARPTDTFRAGPSGTSGESATYQDSTVRWILGPVARLVDTQNGEEISSARFDALVQPVANYSFGLLVAAMAYEGNGTISSATDATGRTTLFQQWKRGTPQRVVNPDGTFRSASVDDNGWIRSISDELGLTTLYDYDAMGRQTMMQAPSEAGHSWNPTRYALSRLSHDESGIQAGHWKLTESLGSARRITYFDGLLRPVLDESFDAEDRAASLSQVFRVFDHGNRLIFESYPGRYR